MAEQCSAAKCFEMRVEFFGIPRARAGVADTVIPLTRDEIELSELLATLSQRFPELSRECFNDQSIRDGFSANINGRRFIRKPDDRIKAGETVLLFSADAGG